MQGCTCHCNAAAVVKIFLQRILFGSVKCKRREIELAEKRNRWYEKEGYKTVLFVDATTNGELAAECNKILKSAKLKKLLNDQGNQIRFKMILVEKKPAKSVK